jgi:hypothetical protein
MRGGKVSPPTEPVRMQSDVGSCSKAMVRARHFAFMGAGTLGGTWAISGNDTGLSLKSRAGTTKVAKWSAVRCECVPETTDQLVLWVDASSKFPLIPNVKDDARLDAVLGESRVRDFAVSTIRGYVAAYSR